MEIFTDEPTSEPVEWALNRLIDVLIQRGIAPGLTHAAASSCSIVIGQGKDSKAAELLTSAGVSLMESPESVVIHRTEAGTLILWGSDERGLVYALTEAARAMELAPADARPLESVSGINESPELSWRSMQLFLCNEELEEEWYFREDFWGGYLNQLAFCRYNNLTLTFGHQTWYLTPPYPFLVELPEFPEVRVRDLSPSQRDRNLAMLRIISEMARNRSLHFTLGVWSQYAERYGPSMVDGLSLENLAEANAAGLLKVLEECPQIDGVQFRMNNESGIDEAKQLEFYEKQFRAVASCGRPIRLDLRAKGLSDETVRLAQEIVPGTVVSTKHWCEHLGMPYPMPAIQQFDIPHYRRYGWWDLLKKPRKFQLVYRLWSAGSQRVLLWGSPSWVRRFMRGCHFGGDGFEVMAPLTNKGGINESAGTWPIFKDAAMRHYKEEYQRYWMFYLLFGRLGYNSNTADEVWKRELQSRAGRAANHIEEAYEATGQILALLTVMLQWSASVWRFWPEMFAGRTLEEDIEVEPSDPTQFYGVGEYVEDALNGKLCGKWTPQRTANHLQGLAARTYYALDQAEKSGHAASEPEFRGTDLDFHILAGLADYHSHRLLAGTQLCFYQRGGSIGRLSEVLSHLGKARTDWQKLSIAADGIYHDNLIFGNLHSGLRGHWKDRLEDIDQEIGRLASILACATPGEGEVSPQYPGESAAAERPQVILDVPPRVRIGAGLKVRIHVRDGRENQTVQCYYRITSQELPFETVTMKHTGDGWYSGSIPDEYIVAKWDLMVFFEVMLDRGNGYRYPDWRVETPYRVIETIE